MVARALGIALALLAAPAAEATESGMIGDVLLQRPWGPGLERIAAEVTPPGSGSFLAAPGPTNRPVRPYLEPRAGPGGTLARALSGDGQALPVAVLPGPRVVALDRAPLALAARGDGGFWALFAGELVVYQSDRPAAAVPTGGALEGLTDQTLLSTPGDGVWLVSSDLGRHYGAGGEATAPPTALPWSGGAELAVAADGALCALDRGSPRILRCLAPSGVDTARPLPDAGPFEQLLAVTADGALTRDGEVLVRHSPEGPAALALQSAGLTAGGSPFVSARDDRTLVVWIQGEPTRRLPLADGAAASTRVVAVDGQRTLVYGGDRASWYSGDAPGPGFAVDDATYAGQIFPHLWSLEGAFPFSATPDGDPVIAASGPGGLLLLRLVGP